MLETGEFERVGSSKTRQANVRLISATNADLQAEVAAGRFRQDLFFRLNTISIHLLRNAVDAALESHPVKDLANGAEARVGVEWRKAAQQLEILVQDNGPGLANTANLFVPFFTTKPGGSGIGLVLCRQIVEAHGGSLLLENRAETSGCIARLYLPLGPD